MKGIPSVLTELCILYTQKKTQYDYDHPMVKISTGQATTADRCPNHHAGCPLSPSPTFQAGLDANKKSCFGYISYMSVTERIRVYTYIYNIYICILHVCTCIQICSMNLHMVVITSHYHIARFQKLKKKLQQASKSFKCKKKVVCCFHLQKW